MSDREIGLCPAIALAAFVNVLRKGEEYAARIIILVLVAWAIWIAVAWIIGLFHSSEPWE